MTPPGVQKRPGSARQMAQAAALRRRQTRGMGKIPTLAVGGQQGAEPTEPQVQMQQKQRVPGGY